MRVLKLGMKRFLVGSAIGLTMLLGGVLSINAQNPTEEYREWQDAQRRAQEEYRDYLRSRSTMDYRDWQQAQRNAQREYIEYQRANNMYNAGRGVGYGYGRNPARRGMYRVYRDGRYYQTDYRGAELLRTAVNRGYQQGYVAGQRDRRYGRGDDYYYNDSMYRNGTFGYQSYVARDQYQYYFQQGFQRGYEDGYNSTSRYGYRSGSNWNILGNVLNTILNLSQN
ncbi:MAG TPA: hypothetical protein VJL58_07200 [Pyrinomonadaceae bacterium]|nr:hypothetical protein [Pyrinomonadaceae bacterium]